MGNQSSFQVDIEIYEDKFGQSGDRILSSHITIAVRLNPYRYRFGYKAV